MNIELRPYIEHLEIDCLDIILKKDNSEHMINYLENLGDRILEIFDYTFESHETLFIFCDENYTKSLTLVLFFFLKRLNIYRK